MNHSREVRFFEMVNLSSRRGYRQRYLVNHMRSRAALLLALCVPLCLGCDPAYFYYPKTDNGELTARISETVDGADIEVAGFDVLIGSSKVVQGLNINNTTDRDVILIKAELSTNGHKIVGDTPANGELQWRSVGPGETGQITCYFDLWDYGGVAEDVLAETATISFQLEIRGVTKVIDVPLRRSSHPPNNKAVNRSGEAGRN